MYVEVTSHIHQYFQPIFLNFLLAHTIAFVIKSTYIFQMDFQKSNALVNKLDERRENQFLNFFLISCLSNKDLSTTQGESVKKKAKPNPQWGLVQEEAQTPGVDSISSICKICSCGKHIKTIDERKLTGNSKCLKNSTSNSLHTLSNKTSFHVQTKEFFQPYRGTDESLNLPLVFGVPYEIFIK